MNMDIYKLKGYIGEGAHGYVMRALNTVTNEDVALKKLVIRSANEGIPNNILREIKVLQQVDCLYVVKLLNIVAQGTGFVLVMEYLPLALSDILKNHNKPLMESQIKKYMKMLLLGMSYLHDVNIMHRDLKPANLLISESGTLKIADFGLARIYSPDEPERPYSHQVATRWYRAPELLYGSRKYTPSIDIWAAGCIFGEMINKAPLFPGETDIEQLAIVLRTLGTPSEEQWPEMKSLPDYNKISFPDYTGIPWSQILPDTRPHVVDFIKRFIQYDNKKRISANEAVLHPYFFIKPLECEMEHMPKPIDYEVEYLNEPDSLLHDLHEILSLH